MYQIIFDQFGFVKVVEMAFANSDVANKVGRVSSDEGEIEDINFMKFNLRQNTTPIDTASWLSFTSLFSLTSSNEINTAHMGLKVELKQFC